MCMREPRHKRRPRQILPYLAILAMLASATFIVWAVASSGILP